MQLEPGLTSGLALDAESAFCSHFEHCSRRASEARRYGSVLL